jgi:hypothetical protein
MLGDAKKRRLFAHLLQSKIRSSTGLSDEFVSGLAAAYDMTDDPAATIAASPATGINSGPWRLRTVETEGFGGLNIWGGPVFRFTSMRSVSWSKGRTGAGNLR